jgi:hypothetical protein
MSCGSLNGDLPIHNLWTIRAEFAGNQVNDNAAHRAFDRRRTIDRDDVKFLTRPRMQGYIENLPIQVFANFLYRKRGGRCFRFVELRDFDESRILQFDLGHAGRRSLRTVVRQEGGRSLCLVRRAPGQQASASWNDHQRVITTRPYLMPYLVALNDATLRRVTRMTHACHHAS